MGNKCLVNTNEGANDKGVIKFHVMPERSDSLINALGSVQATHQAVRDCMESFFKGVANERLNSMNLESTVQKETERRVEVVMKQVMTRVENELYAEAMRLARERLKEIVNNMPLRVAVEVEQRKAVANG